MTRTVTRTVGAWLQARRAEPRTKSRAKWHSAAPAFGWRIRDVTEGGHSMAAVTTILRQLLPAGSWRIGDVTARLGGPAGRARVTSRHPPPPAVTGTVGPGAERRVRRVRREVGVRGAASLSREADPAAGRPPPARMGRTLAARRRQARRRACRLGSPSAPSSVAPRAARRRTLKSASTVDSGRGPGQGAW